MAAGKLGKAGSTTREVTSLSVTLSSNAVAGRTLVSVCTIDWSVTLEVVTRDGWEIVAQHQGGRSSDLVTTGLAIKRRAAGSGAASDTCNWTWGGVVDDAAAADIVELDDDFGAGGVAVASTSAGITSVARSINLGSLRAVGDGFALATVGVSDCNNWDASGTRGPLATWSGSFTEFPDSYSYGGDGVTTEDAGLSIATRTVRADDTVSTTATAADTSGSSSMASGVIAVFTSASVPGVTIGAYDGSRWVDGTLHVYDGSRWVAATGLTVAT